MRALRPERWTRMICPHRPRGPGMRSILYRPLQLAALLFIALQLVSLAVVGALSWVTHQRLGRIASGVRQLQNLQRLGLQAQHLLYEDLAGRSRVSGEMVRSLRAEVLRLVDPEASLSPGTVQRLLDARQSLEMHPHAPRPMLAAALVALREATYHETTEEMRLLQETTANTRTETRLVIGALALVPSAALLTIWLLRQRIFRPIDDLRQLLQELACGRPRLVDVRPLDPLVAPLFANYNEMVGRLATLEEAHRRYATSLESEVQASTRALLTQQQRLARAETLAAVGEWSAAVAHELRNPLAGIQMALSNIRHDLADAGHAARIDVVITELQRITRLLNGLLDQSRHVPEERADVRVAPLVRELLGLVRYQTRPEIELTADVPEGLECNVPPDGLRQALLNLVLNSVGSIGCSDGSVVVDARLEAGALRIRVSDNGPGFPATLLKDGICRFASGTVTGTGLGLAIVQQFVRELDGELTLTNHAPRGACAVLTIPRAG